MVTNAEIIDFLKSKSVTGGFIDGLKIRYRPLVCPFQELFAQVSPGDRVADIGCGSGQLSLLLKKFTKAGEIYGIEISDRLVNNAKALFETEPHTIAYQFEVYNGKDFPAKIGSYNLVFLVDVLHHVPPLQQENFIRSLFKVMAPGSRLVLKDIDRASPLVFFNKIHDLVFSQEIGKEHSLAEASKVCEEAGFRILSNFTKRTLVYPHYFLILEKHSNDGH